MGFPAEAEGNALADLQTVRGALRPVGGEAGSGAGPGANAADAELKKVFYFNGRCDARQQISISFASRACVCCQCDYLFLDCGQFSLSINHSHI
jgi:hypothetical protein